MLSKEINLLEELDNLSKIHILEREEIDSIMIDFASRITSVLKIERMSVWLFNQTHDAIVSLGEYDKHEQRFQKDRLLFKADYPLYFKMLEENRIVVANDATSHPATAELTNDYLKAHNIVSLMDVPLRIAGEMIGVMCFEKCGSPKIFNEQEQSFALSLSIVFASNMEARHRRAYQKLLEKALEEKDMLIKEINHRVRNNFSILISLMRLSKERGNTMDARTIFTEYEQRINSMLKIQDLLYQTKNFTEVNVSDYLKELVQEFKKSNIDMEEAINADIEIKDVLIPTKTAIHLGLIVSEIFLNSVKYVFSKTNYFRFNVTLRFSEEGFIDLQIGDNGAGFDFEKLYLRETLGLPLIKDLSDSIGAIGSFPEPGNAIYQFKLKG